MQFCVYVLTNVSNGKQYVGKAKDIKQRIAKHLSSAATGSMCAIHCAIRKYGWSSFVCEILGVFNSEAAAFLEERAQILNLCTKGSGYNMTDGGDGASGHVQSAETRAKKARAMAGRPIHPNAVAAAKLSNTGRRHSEEARADMSAARRGKPNTPEHNAKIGASKLGKKRKPFSLEHKLRMYAGSLGRKRSPESVERSASSHRGAKMSDEQRIRMGEGKAQAKAWRIRQASGVLEEDEQ